MKLRLIVAVTIFFFFWRAASAHRLDEYLQATILSVNKDQLHLSMRLIPGVAVSSAVIARIDTNGDGVLSQQEQKAYEEQVLSDLTLTIDNIPLRPKLVSASFPRVNEMQAGLGEIHLELVVDLPKGGPSRQFILENHHQNQHSAYLVNCLISSDPNIRIIAQTRNVAQSFYKLEYTQSGAVTSSPFFPWLSQFRDRLNSLGFVSVFRLGVRHIAEGTDHILFLLALLLPAPLMAAGPRWGEPASIRRSMLRILRIVTAFTIGHSTTLVLAALGLISVPSRPIEVLIAVSILVSAIHALRPIFPGREAIIAAFFGLIHGLAFAATLSNLGFGLWERLSGILAFNLGIETMQLIIVAVTMPSLLLMSRTRAYPALRIGGALFAGAASVGWIAERLLGRPSSVDVVVNAIAFHAVWVGSSLCLISVACWSLRNKFVLAQNIDRNSSATTLR